MKHRLHVIGLPHTAVTLEYSSCAYTEKVRKFCNEMTRRGHEVILYAGWQSDAKVAEFVPCIVSTYAKRMLAGKHYTQAPADGPAWDVFKRNVTRAMRRRIQPKDFICISFGRAQQDIANAFPDNIAVEYGVGYSGVFSRFRAFESYAWMHMHYGNENKEITDTDGRWYDAVIPGFFDPDLFPKLDAGKGNYLLYVGRMIDRKGLSVVKQIAKHSKLRLVLAGPGDPGKGDFEHAGELTPEQRNYVMSRATVLIAPTVYVEPFGNVVVEAHACGCPTITTDWGAFTETVQIGFNGFRCRTLAEFVQAIEAAKELDRDAIRDHAFKTYSAPVVGAQFERYFDRLYGLWGVGWGEMPQAVEKAS